MLDRDLAVLYGVPTKVLKQAVRRHQNRFPDDFMFVLNQTEFNNWRSQFVTSNADRKGLRYAPMANTEHGILMLSSVLNSSGILLRTVKLVNPVTVSGTAEPVGI